MRLALALALFWAGPALASDTWFRITDEQGQLIGWQRESVETIPAGRRLTRERVTAFRIKDHPAARLTVRVVREEDAQGRPLSLLAETDRNGSTSRVRLTVAGTTMLVESARGKAQIMRQILLDPALRLADGEWLSGTPMTGDIAEIEPGTTTIQRGRTERSKTSVEEALIHYRNGEFADAWLVTKDGKGEVLRAEKPLPGGRQVFERSAEPVRASQLSAGRAVSSLRFKSPFSISEAALRGHIRYIFRPRAGAPLAVPETAEQRVREQADGTFRIDICSTCGPSIPNDAESLARWRAPSPWIESDAPELVAAARAVAGRKVSERTRMRMLGDIARARISRVEFFGHHSARQAWKLRAGDCTEDANVFAALARAAGIPARVANGLVFMRERYFGSENAFQPHSWVIAYVDGKWESFDISVGSFDATHIALTLGNGEPGPILAANRKAGLLQWEGMAEVRTR
ncbi:transglutaminase-like domain-containing protein [Novosphingobium sp.]|uniref:transglutaminase-like domain-containing protein n=1 Tax=Novosphingobium sp. TaxID=1874826 RepID=UPI00286E5252|nr:transglutaminase-like domain-containing protein [Novosphingobium sp.]